jgi:protein phosphatase
MSLAELLTSAITAESRMKPRDDQVDFFGITDIGKVRKENQDHFLIATVHQQLMIHGTSFPSPEQLTVRGERLASFMLVADGVGGAAAGGEASQLTVETIARYVSSTMQCFQTPQTSGGEKQLLESLREAAKEAHTAVRAEGAGRGESKMASTLTLAYFIWPYGYVVQVGDSRCYHWTGGKLRLVTRDQTLAQDLVDQGVLPLERMAKSPFRNVLARAIGADEATPEVSRVDLDTKSTFLVCSDGLTKHVSDEEIGEQIAAMKSSEQLCRALVQMALDRGGSDNVTVLAVRRKPN